MKKLIFILSLSTIFFTSCQNKEKSNSETTINEDVIKVDSVNFDYESPVSISKNKDTTQATVHIKYPKLSGQNQTVLNKINDFMAKTALKGLNGLVNLEDPENIAPNDNLTTIAKGFEKSYKESNTDVDYATSWSYEGYGDTTFISKKIIGLLYNESTYSGGAHGNYGTYYYNFDAKTGDLLILTDYISDTTAFRKVVEKFFYENEQKEAKAGGFEFDKSFYFFDQPFALPQNIAIKKDGLDFIYNPYEAAAYARGAITFSIPYKNLEGIIRKERIF
jgi:hypothetical protein